MKFRKKKGWISPERYEAILKMLHSENDEDFQVGAELLSAMNIRPSRLLNEVTKAPGDWYFYYYKDQLMRHKKEKYSFSGVFVKDITRLVTLTPRP